MKISLRTADLALRPFDRALAASLGDHPANRLRRQFHTLYFRTCTSSEGRTRNRRSRRD